MEHRCRRGSAHRQCTYTGRFLHTTQGGWGSHVWWQSPIGLFQQGLKEHHQNPQHERECPRSHGSGSGNTRSQTLITNLLEAVKFNSTLKNYEYINHRLCVIGVCENMLYNLNILYCRICLIIKCISSCFFYCFSILWFCWLPEDLDNLFNWRYTYFCSCVKNILLCVSKIKPMSLYRVAIRPYFSSKNAHYSLWNYHTTCGTSFFSTCWIFLHVICICAGSSAYM